MKLDPRIKVYDPNHKGECRSERCEQIDAMSWLECHYPEHFEAAFHCPSETRGTPLHHALRAKEGVKAGIPDIIHFAGTDRWRIGMFELKRLNRRKSKLSKEQVEILRINADAGGFSAVCYGVDAFKVAWVEYLQK